MGRRAGFTLIEVIVAISLILLVSTMVVPSFVRISDEQKIKLDIATANEIANIARMHYIETGKTDGLSERLTEVYGTDSVKSKYLPNQSFAVSLSKNKAKVTLNNVVLVDDSTDAKDARSIIESLTGSNSRP